MSLNSFARSVQVQRAVSLGLIAMLLAVALFVPFSLAHADFTYTVKSGDSLAKIARNNNTTVDALVAANKAKYPCLATNPACLQIGWVLTIGGGGAPSAASGPSTYTVQSGDSLAKIAKKLGVNFNDLIAANKKDRPCLAAAKPCALQVGWVLNVPGGGSAPAPTPVPTAAPGATPAASGGNGTLVIVMCQGIEATVTVFHDGQIIQQGSLHTDTPNTYSLPAGHYDIQFNAEGYFNLNLSYDIVPGGTIVQPIGQC